MILIADSGSTTCDWLLADLNGKRICKQVTPGINPVMFSSEEIGKHIAIAEGILQYANKITHIYFYSAGCGLSTNQNLMREVLAGFYTKAAIEVQSDVVAAVRATATGPSIVCILGTGSNSCYYDGEKVHIGFDSLGYSVMDEASGNYFGKKLLRDYFYKKMPKDIAERFASEYELTPESVLLYLYKKPMPAQYLASFSRIIFSVGWSHIYFKKLLEQGFDELIEYQFQLWPNHKKVPIHFIGSIAFFAKDILKAKLESTGLTLGSVVRSPIEELLVYHEEKLRKNN